ncbi:MAG: hypothetical protein P1U86_17250 [Verrucomicrobiales bacterium]|nr:hypothetical protein [Verrucomicrobiales bacterium]
MKRLLTIVAATLTFFVSSGRAQEQPHPAIVAGDRFWKVLVDSSLEDAYRETSARYQKSNSLDDFRAQVEESKAAEMTGYKLSKATASDDGKSALIVGRGKNADGKSVMARVQLLAEEGVFRMFTFTVQRTGGKLPPPIRDAEKSLALTRATLVHLGEAIENDDIASAYNRLPMEDRQQNSLAAYKDVLRGLNQSPFGPIKDLADRVTVQREGVMKDKSATYFLSAEFPERKRRLNLEFRSVWTDVQDEAWLMNWRSVYFNPDSPTDPPAEAESLALAGEALKSLFDGFEKGSLERFYDEAAPLFREMFSLQRVEGAYPAFTTGQVPYGEWKLDQLRLITRKVTGDTGPSLELQVEIPTATQPAFATLRFLHETTEWSPIGITFHSTKPALKQQ